MDKETLKWIHILEICWKEVEALTRKQLEYDFGHLPFRKLGDEAWIVAELYHQIKTNLEKFDLSNENIIVSAEAKPTSGKSVDLAVTKINPENASKEYILLLECKHSTPWDLLNFHRDEIKKGFYKKKYYDREELSFEEILLPNKRLNGSNILADVVKLHQIVSNLPLDSIKIIGIAYILEESNIGLDTIVKDTVFTDMVYPKLIQTIPNLKISSSGNSYFVELSGWKNKISDWKLEWRQISSINSDHK